MRNTAFLVILLVTCILFSSVLFADQVITITLDPPKEETPKDSQSNLELNRVSSSKNSQAQTEYRTQVSSPSAGKKDTPIGRVGVVVSSSADIRSYPGRRGYSLFKCPKDTYLAVLGQNGDWYGVLMIDSSTGWIEKKHVRLLNYQVTGDTSRSSLGARIVNTALQYLGIPYRWGGYSANGIDCSGFVKAVFAAHGISLPRVSRDQALVGTPVGWNQLQPGDRLYFACKGGAIDHTGIYMGNGLFIHSSSGRGGVAVDDITKAKWASTLVAARRS